MARGLGGSYSSQGSRRSLERRVHRAPFADGDTATSILTAAAVGGKWDETDGNRCCRCRVFRNLWLHPQPFQSQPGSMKGDDNSIPSINTLGTIIEIRQRQDNYLN